MEMSSICNVYKHSAIPGFAKQIMLILFILMLHRELSHLNGRKIDHRLRSETFGVIREHVTPKFFRLS